jgi:(2R)-3-sulfolactate dehydrogenase (NADP+)
MFQPEDAAKPQRIGHLIVTLDPRRFDVEGGNGAQARFDELARRVEDAGGRLPGSRRALPDEIDVGAPLPLAGQLEDELAAWAERLGVRSRS